MLCLTRDKQIQLPMDEKNDFIEEVYATSLDEKVVTLPASRPDEEEMQQRLSDLRAQIKEAKLDWYVVPSEDEHLSEVVADSEKRRAWISNFDGSAGTALVPSSSIDAKAILFADSRYWIAADESIPKKNWKVHRVGASGGSGRDAVVGGWVDWIIDGLEDGVRVGIDPKLISYDVAKSIKARLSDRSTELVPVKQNLVDKINTPLERSLGPIEPYDIKLSGEETSSKLERLRKIIGEKARTDHWIYLLPALPTIAWLYNYRCTSDIPFCPVAFAYAALTPTEAFIFVDERKVEDKDLICGWKKAGVTVRKYGVDEIQKIVSKSLADVRARSDKAKVKILASKDSSWALINACAPETVTTIPCPVDEAKVLKNETELQNYRNAYLRDGRAMVRWLAWLEQRLVKDEKTAGEWAAAMVLTRYRRQEEMWAGPAYEDISATGANAASAHYAPSRGNESDIELDTPYVIDSGPQYLDATIDTTRTIFFGKTPTDDMKRAYTRVLQGHIAAASATFPPGTDAYALGLYAKKYLFEDGLDFGHGLGHGVGNYSSVHEFPTNFGHGFSFKAGHVTTIEPGFYLEGQWGMRIESTYICKEVETKYDFGGKHWLGFECVTRVPIDTRMIDWSLTTKSEIRWVNAYNTAVQDAIMPLLDDDDLDKDARDWLKRNCKPKTIYPWTGA